MPASEPAATAASDASRSPSRRGRIAWVSGSPKRQLNSSTRGPVLGEHEAGVEEALERSPPGGQLAENWQVDSLHESLRLLLEPRDGRIASHPSRVRAPVVVEQTLEILRRGKRERVRAVAEREERDLATDEKLLDDDTPPESPRSGQGGGELLLALADEDALSRRQPVGLDHARCSRLSELISGRHPGGLQDLLGEGLRALDAGCSGARSEDRRPGDSELVGEPGHERCLGADHDEVDRKAPGEAQQRLAVVCLDGVTGSERGNAGISGGGVQLVEVRAAGDPPGERVFAAAAADDEDVHAASLFGRPGIRRVCVAEAGPRYPPAARSGIDPEPAGCR